LNFADAKFWSPPRIGGFTPRDWTPLGGTGPIGSFASALAVVAGNAQPLKVCHVEPSTPGFDRHDMVNDGGYRYTSKHATDSTKWIF